MILEVGSPELFRQFIAPYLPSTDYYELRSRFDNLRYTLPVTRYMSWPSLVQEIVNADLSFEEAEILSRSLRIHPVNDVDAIIGCWSLVNLFLQNETCADCVKRSFLVLPVLHAAITEDCLPMGRLENLIETHALMVLFVSLYCEDYNLIAKVIHIKRKDIDDESFVSFSWDCFVACILFDRLEVFKKLMKDSLIIPLDQLGTSQRIFTSVISPGGLAAFGEPIPNNPFVPSHLKAWFDFIIDDCGVLMPANLGAMLLDFGCIRSAIYFIEDRRVLVAILYATGNSFADFLDYAGSYTQKNPTVVEYFENLPYAKMTDLSIVSACRFDELPLVKMVLPLTDPRDIDFDSCIAALNDPVFTLERRNTHAIRAILDSKKPTKAAPQIVSHKKRSKRYCCY